MVDWLAWLRMSVTSEDVCSVGELCSVAREDVSAATNHVRGPGELLAVEDQEISVIIKIVLAIPALLLKSLNSVALVLNLFVIVIDSVIVVGDKVVIVFNA